LVQKNLGQSGLALISCRSEVPSGRPGHGLMQSLLRLENLLYPLDYPDSLIVIFISIFSKPKLLLN